MSVEQARQIDEQLQAALEELQGLIQARYPEASFVITHGEDPEGVYLKATVDLEDVDEVIDVYRDRLLSMQVDEELPVYVIPLQPVERVLDAMRARKLPPEYNALRGAAINP